MHSRLRLLSYAEALHGLITRIMVATVIIAAAIILIWLLEPLSKAKAAHARLTVATSVPGAAVSCGTWKA